MIIAQYIQSSGDAGDNLNKAKPDSAADPEPLKHTPSCRCSEEDAKEPRFAAICIYC